MSEQDTINANEAASAEDVMLVVDGVNDIAQEWAEFAVRELQHNADDPCYREIVLLDRREAAAGVRTMGETLASGAANDLARAIERSINAYDEDSAAGVWMHSGFHDWLIDRNVLGPDPEAIGVLLAGGPWGAGHGRELVREKLPPMSSFVGQGPRWNPPSGEGLYIAPGVYLYAAGRPWIAQLAEGKLQGTTIRSEYWRWKHHIERTVSGFARPIARWELQQLVVGPSSGDLPRWVWAPGDPIAPDSILGNIYEQEDDLSRLITAAAVECEVFRRDEAEHTEWAKEQDETERERDHDRRTGWQRVAMVGVAALALMGALRGKR